MRIVTLNCNGIRSAARKGLFGWLAAIDADVVCLQETRAQEHQLALDEFAMAGYRGVFVDAQRRGYSGVAIYSKGEALAERRTLGWPEVDAEGRFVQIDLGALTIASLYVPSGISGEARQAFKMSFLQRFRGLMAELLQSGRNHMICGDYNIAHQDIDIYDPVGKANVTGFLPMERRWMDSVLELGWCDAFRVVNPEPKQYSWWSNWPAAWQKNLGWRIDYQLVTPGLRETVRNAWIYKETRFSDHSPVIVEYALP